MGRIIRSSNPEIDGCEEIEDLKPGECGCGAMRDVHMREVPGCEYHDHHCPYCHGRGICTKASCKRGEEPERDDPLF